MAEDAQLLVIGTDGPASLAGLAHESTSRAVIRLSSRPVLLVPAHAQNATGYLALGGPAAYGAPTTDEHVSTTVIHY